MSAFANGFRLGLGSYQQALDNQAREVERQRAEEVHNWRRDERKRIEQDREREDAAVANFDNVQRGVSADTQGQIKDTYGMTPQQISQAGDGLKEKLASYDVPDSYDLQTAPPEGAKPKFTADQVKTAAPSQLDLERAMQGVALAKRDYTGVRQSLDKQRQIQAADDTRNFAQETVRLYQERTKSPEAMKAWIAHVSPYAEMVTRYQGFAGGGAIDPETGELRLAPEGGQPRNVPLDRALPYMMRLRELSSQYGDPLAAAEALNKMSEAERSAALELRKPQRLKPGETLQVYNPETRKYEVVAQGNIPAGYEAVPGPDGEMTLRRIDGGSRGSSGSGSGGKVDDPAKVVADAWEFASTKGEVKLPPNQLAQGRRIAEDVFRNNSGLSPALSAEVAMELVQDPNKARLELNYNTGAVDLIYQNPRINQGRPISVSQSAGTLQEFEKSAGGTKQMQAAVTGLVDHMVRAVPEDKRGQAREQLVSIATNPELRKQYLQQARDMGKDVQVLDRQLALIAQYGAPKPQAPAGQDGPSVLDSVRQRLNVGGLRQPATDPNSAAGRYQARQEQARAQQSEADANRQEQQRLLSQQFARDAQSMDPLEFVRKYDPIRRQLTTEQAAELKRIEQRL